MWVLFLVVLQWIVWFLGCCFAGWFGVFVDVFGCGCVGIGSFVLREGVCFAFSWLVLVAGVVVSKFGCGSWVCGWGMWWLRLGLCGKFGGWFLV